MAQSSFYGSGAPGSATGHRMSRRGLLRGAAMGAGALTLPALLTACGDGPGGDKKTVTVGSNSSDEVPKKAFAAAFTAYEKKSGKKVDVNTTDHNEFQTNITRYLQGTPDDVFMWFAGYRMQYFAEKGLLTDIDDVWKGFKGFSQALKDQSTHDGKQYFVPYYYYPWAVFHRKSLFEKQGYEQPKNWDDFIALAKQMHKDGTPVAFCDKDGWPAMGTFDYINMRLNGYDFHKGLMAGTEAWTDAKVKKVFDLWRELMPYYQKGALGRTWEEAAWPCRSARPEWPSSECRTRASSSRRTNARTSTSSPSRRSTPSTGRTRWRLPSTVSSSRRRPRTSKRARRS